MGLRFDPTESYQLLGNFSANMSTCDGIVLHLTQGNHHLLSVLAGRQLSGSGFEAGKRLFAQLIEPTITRATQTIQGAKDRLQHYRAIVNSAGMDFLDEDVITQQIQTLRQRQALIADHLMQYQRYAWTCNDPEMSEMLASHRSQLSDTQGTVEDEIKRLEEKLERLYDLDNQLRGLFDDVATEMTLLSQAVSFISATHMGHKVQTYYTSKTFQAFQQAITDPIAWGTESLGRTFDNLEKDIEEVTKKGKNWWKSVGARLQPRDSDGKFIKDNFKPRKWLSGKLKGMSNEASKSVTRLSKWGGRSLTGFNAYSSFKEFDDEYHKPGSAVVYSAVTTGVTSYFGGAVATFSGSVATAAGATAGGFVATFAAPVAGCVLFGIGVGIAAKGVYDHIPAVKSFVDGIGDKIDSFGNAFCRALSLN